MSTTAATERVVLAVLAEAGDLLTPEPQLLREVIAQSATGVTRSDLKAVLGRLDGKHQVIGITGDDYTKWKISAAGKARLAEANL